MLRGLLHKAHTHRLHEALRDGDCERVRQALRKGASADAPFSLTPESPPRAPVLQCLLSGQAECLAALLLAGAQLPETDETGQPLLNLAILAPRNGLSLLTQLLQAGLPADLSDTLQQTGQERPLFCCLHLPDTQVMLHISRLVQYGADLNRATHEGDTVLREALLSENQALVTALISSGAALPADLEQLACPDVLKALARRTHDDLLIRQRLQPF